MIISRQSGFFETHKDIYPSNQCQLTTVSSIFRFKEERATPNQLTEKGR